MHTFFTVVIVLLTITLVPPAMGFALAFLFVRVVSPIDDRFTSWTVRREAARWNRMTPEQRDDYRRNQREDWRF